MALAEGKGFGIGNLDATIIAQQPRMAPHIRSMVENVAEACRCDIEQVNIKATTTEELGFEGRGEGISAHAVVLLRRIRVDEELEVRA
jgi:2-C-methyl-D-erythritol 2,4-cyclodiphosphate synthase